MRRRGPKRLTPQQVTGPLGVNLIEGILLRMGFPWHPTRQELEGGIDGFIEIRDPATGNLTNTVLNAAVSRMGVAGCRGHDPEHGRRWCDMGCARDAGDTTCTESARISRLSKLS